MAKIFSEYSACSSDPERSRRGVGERSSCILTFLIEGEGALDGSFGSQQAEAIKFRQYFSKAVDHEYRTFSGLAGYQFTKLFIHGQIGIKEVKIFASV